MPPPKKLDLIPVEIRHRLAQALQDRGFSDIIGVTEELNFWLEEQGLSLTVGKTAVGEFSKLLKTQREAFAIAETLLSDMDIEAESGMHRALMQMIAAAMFQLMQAVAEKGEHIDAKSLANLARTLKDLMHSAGLREKIMEAERERIAAEARRQAQDEMAGRVDGAVAEAGLSAERAADLRKKLLGVRS